MMAMMIPKSASTSVQGHGALAVHEVPLNLAKCKMIFDNEPIPHAVGALEILVQEGNHVSSNVFYRLLRRCIKAKDLVSGTRIHAITVKSGYEGDSFLATHLIGLYASHGRLKEAMRVFTTVPAPDAYNWATIIFAYARHGEATEAAEAIQLYRKMCQSTTVEPDDRIYLAVLKACAVAGNLVAGKEVHAHILARQREPHKFVQTGLVNMYAKCGSLGDARRLFDKLPEKDVVTWTGMIAGYAKQGMGQEALQLYKAMQKDGQTSPNSVTYVCLLQACASVGVGAVDEGKQLHAEIKQRGLQKDVVVGGSLVNMYAKCGRLDDARWVFDRLPVKNTVACNAMLAGYATQGMGPEALSLHSRLQEEGFTPSSVTYVCLLQACASVGVGALHEGQQLHACIKEQGLQEDVFLGGSLVNMYAKCGSLNAARRLFDTLSDKDVVTWTAMIAGYAQQGMGEEALHLYRSMQQEGLTPADSVTYVCLLQACGSVGKGSVSEQKQLRTEIEERGLQDDAVLGGSLVNMYVKSGSLEEARRVFDKLPERNLVSWTALIAGYAQQGMGWEALRLYRSMQQEGLAPPDCVTYAALLQACASVGVEALHEGKQLHAEINERGLQEDVVLGGSLVSMYVKCGSLEDACTVFGKLAEKDVVTWTAMIAGYAQRSMGQQALHLYKSMPQEGFSPPDPVIYVCLLQACASMGVGALCEGKQLHSQIRERGLQEDTVVGSSLVNMYAKCGSLEDARIVFNNLSGKDVVAWTAMIAGYAQQGMGEEALSLYRSMQQEGLTPPDCVTYVCLLQACAFVAALPLGKQLHAQIQTQGLQADPGVGAALVNMFAKCGSISDALQVFDSLHERTMEAWNAVIGGYARLGDNQVVFDLFGRMRLQGIQPDEITYLNVLTVCSHAGLVEKGQAIFEMMRTDCSISATVDHYVVMVDLLGRAGHLYEALEMAKTMPFPTTDVVWSTLLGACRKWKHVEIGEEAFQGALSVDDRNAAAYVAMSDIYASAQMWEAAKTVLDRKKNLQVWKKPGQSWWTDMDGVVHKFVAGDKVHPESEGIHVKPEKLVRQMKKDGRMQSSQLYRALRECIAQKDLILGRRVHALSVEAGYERDSFLANHIVRMYASHGKLKEAMDVFTKVPTPDTYMWASIISAYAEHGKSIEAINLYRQMRQSTVKPNCYVFVAALKACTAAVELAAGKEVHLDFVRSGIELDVFIGNSLLNMYAKCGSLADSRAVFDSLSTKDVVTWNAMIGGYAQQGLGNEALALYACMQQESTVSADRVTYVCLLQACAAVSALQEGKKLHLEIQQKGLECNVVIGSCLVDMYTKCGSLTEARGVFDRLRTRNVVTWTAMIAGYTEHGLGQEALTLYAQMQEDGMTSADHVTFVCLLQACAIVGDLCQGKQLHAHIQQSRLDSDVVIGNGLVDMYAKCGSLQDAQEVFDRLPSREVTTWNALISGYARQGRSQEALALYGKMQEDGMTLADHVTFICLLNACANAGALHQGKQLHAQIERRGLDAHVAVGSSLVDMYGKCGRLEEARSVFDRLPVKNVVTWNALINSYAQHSDGQMALLCFDEMQQQCVQPDDVTFLSLLVACSHEGMVHEGEQCFRRMLEEYKIQPFANHYSCMVDLLSRSGSLDEAEGMLQRMPFANDLVGWTALLSACKIHGDIERANRCFDYLVAQEPACANAYVLLGSMYANAGRWSDVENIENLRRAAGAWKKPAKACIEIMDKVREFTVGEERVDLSLKLRSENVKLKDQGGHLPQTELVLKALPDGNKEDALCGHAEKLALAYGLLHTPDGTPLLVTKNLRMCNDCHSSTKIMSGVEKREIVVRDAHRVHRFVDGSCSCGDRH